MHSSPGGASPLTLVALAPALTLTLTPTPTLTPALTRSDLTADVDFTELAAAGEALGLLPVHYGAQMDLELPAVASAGVPAVSGAGAELRRGVADAFYALGTFMLLVQVVLLNLLIAIFNTTYERVLTNSVAEWLFVRLRQTTEFELRDVPGVQEYYDQLAARDGQRAVRATGKDVANLVETGEGILPGLSRSSPVAASDDAPSNEERAGATTTRSGGRGGRIN